MQNDPEKLRDLALGRASGTRWKPDERSVNYPPSRRPPPSDERCDPPDEDLVAEDEEGMIGHPHPKPERAH